MIPLQKLIEEPEWKKEFRKTIIDLDDQNHRLSVEEPVKGDIYFDGIEVEGFIENLITKDKGGIDDNQVEWLLKTFLEELDKKVFIKSTNSVTGVPEELNPVIEDQEAVIKISGEWDREDIKAILQSVISKLQTLKK